MPEKMTWEEIQQQYPDEWVLVSDYELSEWGQISAGSLVAHSKSKEEVFSYPTDAPKVGLLYTGVGNFRGFRSHAEDHGV